MATKIAELRLKINTYQKKIEQAEAELELLYHQLDEEMEKSLDK